MNRIKSVLRLSVTLLFSVTLFFGLFANHALAADSVKSRIIKVVTEVCDENPGECYNFNPNDLEAPLFKESESFYSGFGQVEAVMALEEAFDTDIPDEDAEELTNIQSMINYVYTHL